MLPTDDRARLPHWEAGPVSGAGFAAARGALWRAVRGALWRALRCGARCVAARQAEAPPDRAARPISASSVYIEALLVSGARISAMIVSTDRPTR